MALSDIYTALFGKGSIQDGDVISLAEHGRKGGISTGQGFKYVQDIGGMEIESYDYVSMALSAGDTTETYTLKSGGSGGNTVATITVVYTDNTRQVLSTVTKT